MVGHSSYNYSYDTYMIIVSFSILFLLVMFPGLTSRGIPGVPNANGYQLVARTRFISYCIMSNQFHDAANVKIIDGP